MHWLIADLLMFASSVALYLAVRRASLRKMSVSSTNLAMFAVPLPIFIALSIASRQAWHVTLLQLLILAATGAIVYFSNLISLKSIELAANPGYSLVVSKSYVILTTLVAVPLFHARLSPYALLAIILIILFSCFIFIQRPQHGQNKGHIWLLFAMGALVASSKPVLTAKLLLDQGIQPLMFVTYVFIVANLCLLVVSVIKRQPPRVTGNHMQVFLLIGLLGVALNYFNFLAIGIAPNVGYVNATYAGSIGLVTLLSAWLFKDELTLRKLIGVLGVIGALTMLLLS